MIKLINKEELPDVFRVADLVRLSRGKATARSVNYMVSRLLEEKKLVRIKNGMYSKTGDVFYIAYRLYNGYIGFSSALYLYGLKDEIEAAVYVCVPKHAKAAMILGKTIEPVNMADNDYGASLIELNGHQILVSTYAKTIFDMLSKPRYANYFDMYRAVRIRPLAAGEWKELLYYAKSSSISDIRRIGYATDGIAPGWFLDELERLSRKGYRTSFFFKHESRNYNSRWSIFDSLGMRRWMNGV